jgi:hypothetical protein
VPRDASSGFLGLRPIGFQLNSSILDRLATTNAINDRQNPTLKL